MPRNKQLYNIDIESLLWLPANVYWVDTECKVLGFNTHTANLFSSLPSDWVGLGYDEMAAIGKWTEGQGESFQNDDIEVLSTGRAKACVVEPLLPHPDGRIRQYITTRSPLRNQDGKIMGVLGISFEADCLQNAQHAMVLNNHVKKFSQLNKFHSRYDLTNRQAECLHYLVRGMTAKQTAKALNLSYRTVEYYLEILKEKFNCINRAELIAKAIEIGFGR